MKRKIEMFLLIFAMLLTSISPFGVNVQAAEEIIEASGTFGEASTWKLEYGTLTISGSGNVDWYSIENPAPWYDYREQILTLVIEDGVNSIGDYSFYNCNYLEEVYLPDSLSSIGEYAFSECSRLKKIELPDSIWSLQQGAFSGCSSLEEIKLPNSIYGYSIGSNAFSGCTSLQEISIPDSVESISSWAFTGCTNLRKIEIGADEIWGLAFQYCYNLEEVVLKNGVQAIYSGAFDDSYALTEVDIPDSVTEIEIGAFRTSVLESINVSNENQVYASVDGVLYNKDITELILCPGGKETVEISEGVTSIGANAFWKCQKITEVTIPTGVKTIGDYAFYRCDELKKIELPEQLTSIGDGVFSYCSELSKVIIPESVTSIGDLAFWKSGLGAITIPKTVTSIGCGVFWQCNNLQEIIFEGNVPELTVYSGSDAMQQSYPSGLKEGISIGNIFYEVTATAYYPENNETYSEKFFKQCGGSVEWKIASKGNVDEIIQQIENAEEGTIVETRLENTNILHKEVLEVLQGKNVTLNIVMEEGSTWSINGNNVMLEEITDVDLSVKKSTEGNISDDVITSLAGNRLNEQLVFADEGVFAIPLQFTTTLSTNKEKAVMIQMSDDVLQLKDSALIKNDLFTFEIINKADTAIIYGTNGDTNGDDSVTIKDTMQMLHHISNRNELNEVQKGFADVDMNDNVNLQDLMRVMHYVSGRTDSVYEAE